MPSKHLIALAFSFNAALIALSPITGALALVATLPFAGFLVWLERQPAGVDKEIEKLKASVQELKSTQEKLILRGPRG